MSKLQKLVARATDSFTEIIIYYVAIILFSGFLFSRLEDKPLFESFWWACVTGLTIGYGDMYPVTIGGKLVALVLMHIVPLVIIPLIVARLLLTVVEDKNQFTHEEQEEIKADLKAIKTALRIDQS